MKRVGVETEQRPRLLMVCFADKEVVDDVYHTRSTARKGGIWIRRFMPRSLKEAERHVGQLRKRRGRMIARGRWGDRGKANKNLKWGESQEPGAM